MELQAIYQRLRASQACLPLGRPETPLPPVATWSPRSAAARMCKASSSAAVLARSLEFAAAFAAAFAAGEGVVSSMAALGWGSPSAGLARFSGGHCSMAMEDAARGKCALRGKHRQLDLYAGGCGQTFRCHPCRHALAARCAMSAMVSVTGVPFT